MAISYTANKNIQVPALNDLNWNVPLNANWNELDQLAGSSFPISIGVGSTVALTSSTAAVSSVYWYSAQQLVVTSTGTLTSSPVITLPANITGTGTMGGSWIVINNISAVDAKTANVITSLPASGSATFTVATAPVNGTIVILTTSGRLPGGFYENVEYYAVNRTATTFQLSATYGGTAITSTETSTTSSTNTATYYYALTIRPASGAAGTGAVIKNATQGVIYYDGTKVEYADTAVLTQLDTIDGPFTVTGPTTLYGPVAIGDNGGLTIDADVFPDLTLGSIVEKGNYLTTGWDSSVGYDVVDQTILYNSASSTSTFYVSIRGRGTTLPLSQILKDIGDTITCVYIIICSSTAHYCTEVQIDGTTTGVTTFWQGGAPPTAGVASARNVYTFTVMKVSATPTYQIFASLVAFDT
jgi:hypothetical protein